MNVDHGLDRVVETASALSAVAQDLVVLHAGEGVLDAGTDPAVLGVVFFLAGQEWPAGAFAVRDDESGVDVRAVAQDGDAFTLLGQAGVPPRLRIGGGAGGRPGRAPRRLLADRSPSTRTAVPACRIPQRTGRTGPPLGSHFRRCENKMHAA